LKQENSFSVYAGLGSDQMAEIFRVDEVSEDWNRCCCYPNHPFKLEIRQYIPGVNEPLHSGSGHDHFFADLMRDVEKFDGEKKMMKLREIYQQHAVAMTAVREGAHCKSCFASPGCCHRAYGCWILNSCCADGITLMAGATDEADPKHIGNRSVLNDDKKVSTSSTTTVQHPHPTASASNEF
jgi:hypothetical protein